MLAVFFQVGSVRRRSALGELHQACGDLGCGAAFALQDGTPDGRFGVVQRQRGKALARAGLEAREVLVPRLYEMTSMNSGGAARSSPVRSMGPMRRSSASGCSTTVVACAPRPLGSQVEDGATPHGARSAGHRPRRCTLADQMASHQVGGAQVVGRTP